MIRHKMWRRSGIFDIINVSLVIVIVRLFSSCGSSGIEEDKDIVANYEDLNPRIEIYAGSAPMTTRSGTTKTQESSEWTRSETEPSRVGYCEADRLHIWIYKSKKIYNNTGNGSSDVTSPPYDSQLTLSDYQASGAFNSERFFTYEYAFKMGSYRCYCGFALPSIAYKYPDEDIFTTNSDYTTAYKNLFIIMNCDDKGINEKSTSQGYTNEIFRTPEFFFGYLKFSAKGNVDGDMVELVSQQPDEKSFYVFSSNTDFDSTLQVYFYGKLYRIVSQYNLSLTEIDTDKVERIELYLSNVPLQLKLNGKHGTYYDVTSSTDCFEKTVDGEKDLADNYIRVATTNDFSGNTAKLSCFLLPSLKGREMCIRICYKDNIVKEDGQPLVYEDFKIQPKRDVVLRNEDASVYAGGEIGDEKELWDKDNLYIYNRNTHMFYSYANIRVNLSGRYSDLVSDKSSSDLDIKVSTDFEEEHDIKLK